MKQQPVETATSGVSEQSSTAVPPYVPYRTLKNFIDGLKVGIPNRIDRSVMGSMSGAVQGQLMAALRYLALISPKGLPTDRLTRWVNSEGPERQKIMREILATSYEFLFKDFSLQSATTRELEEQFGKAGASGETVRKCMAFFMTMAKEAEVSLSPHIKPFQGAARAPRGRRVANGRGAQPEVEAEAASETGMTWAQMLLSKFPSFDPAWPDDVKAKWFEAFAKLMKQGEEEGFS